MDGAKGVYMRSSSNFSPFIQNIWLLNAFQQILMYTTWVFIKPLLSFLFFLLFYKIIFDFALKKAKSALLSFSMYFFSPYFLHNSTQCELPKFLCQHQPLVLLIGFFFNYYSLVLLPKFSVVCQLAGRNSVVHPHQDIKNMFHTL